MLKPIDFAVLPLDLSVYDSYFRPLNCISVNVIYKTDCILCKLGYVGSISKQARVTWAKQKYDIKNNRIEQSGLTDHLQKEVHHNQSFKQKLGNLRMVLIDQVAGEIIVNNGSQTL